LQNAYKIPHAGETVAQHFPLPRLIFTMVIGAVKAANLRSGWESQIRVPRKRGRGQRRDEGLVRDEFRRVCKSEIAINNAMRASGLRSPREFQKLCPARTISRTRRAGSNHR